VWVADSFEGLPIADVATHPVDAFWAPWAGRIAVDIETVRRNFARYGLLDDQVHFLKGWFTDTLPDAPIGRVAVLRLDGDLYQSTWDALTHLYPKLSPGGFLIVDDYVYESCSKAVHDYRAQHGIDEPIHDIDGMGAYWRKRVGEVAVAKCSEGAVGAVS